MSEKVNLLICWRFHYVGTLLTVPCHVIWKYLRVTFSCWSYSCQCDSIYECDEAARQRSLLPPAIFFQIEHSWTSNGTHLKFRTTLCIPTSNVTSYSDVTIIKRAALQNGTAKPKATNRKTLSALDVITYGGVFLRSLRRNFPHKCSQV